MTIILTQVISLSASKHELVTFFLVLLLMFFSVRKVLLLETQQTLPCQTARNSL